MTRRAVLPACLLLLWTLTAPVHCDKATEIKVKTVANGIVLSCGDGNEIISPDDAVVTEVKYEDGNTGEYRCVIRAAAGDASLSEAPKIYLKFRSCDNCIELDTSALTGIVVGEVVATIMIGAAVYIIASQSRRAPVASNKKSSDRQHLVPNEVNRPTNDHYQPLRPKGGQRETYDVLSNRR